MQLLIWALMNVLKEFPIRVAPSLIFFLISFILSAQEKPESHELNILFYNTENFFDTRNDPLTLDDEFLPNGSRFWSGKRFRLKLNHTAKTILASCGFHVPAIVGLCEVENRYVLEALVRETPLANLHYRIIHKDSPDERGIDVALIYRPEEVEPLLYHYYPLKDDQGRILKTREILYACFLTSTRDTVHLFFNHWPSRYGGQAETEPLRMLAARTLRTCVDRILDTEKNPAIVIMGDFNDQPQSKSLKSGLKTKGINCPEPRKEMINLSEQWPPQGTLKYKQSWQIFDQVIVSGFLLQDGPLHVYPGDARIADLAFLFERDPKYKGKRLYRTYVGYKYHGGFSDHLPVLLKLTPANAGF